MLWLTPLKLLATVGEAVVVFGKIIKAPGAQIHGNTQEVVSFRPLGDAEGLTTWFTKCLLMGRPLAFDSRVLWAWYIAFGCLAFYALIALIALIQMWPSSITVSQFGSHE